MFPWNYGFHWTVGSALFLGAFYCVVMVVAAIVIAALVRAQRAAAEGREAEIRWHSGFDTLPARDRLCRHALTGEFPHRVCPNGFDCRRCETHARFATPRDLKPQAAEEEILGMAFPLDRLYHRGHTSVLPHSDGTVLVELDEFGRRLIGAPDRVELPPPGTRLRTNGPGWRICKRQADVCVLSPVDGEVVDVSPSYGGCLLVKPTGNTFDFCHLLTPSEVKPWLLREMDRLQLALSAEGVPTLADGGVPVGDISVHYPDADWDAVCGEMFLQS